MGRYPLLLLLAALALPPRCAAAHWPRVRLAGFFAGGGYLNWGPGHGPYGFSPWLWSGYYPGYFTGFDWAQDKGEIRLPKPVKDAEV